VLGAFKNSSIFAGQRPCGGAFRLALDEALHARKVMTSSGPKTTGNVWGFLGAPG